MDLNDVIAQLGSLRNYSADNLKADPESENRDIWLQDVEACETAIRILAAFINENCRDFEGALDILQDYRTLSKQYSVLHRKFEVGGKPIHKDAVWHCPSCNRRVHPRHSFCHCCGKRLRWEE